MTRLVISSSIVACCCETRSTTLLSEGLVRGLGLDRRPQLMPVYFGNYRRVVYLAQTESKELQSMAQDHAEYLGLEYLYHYAGDRPLSLLLAPTLEARHN